MQEKKGERVAVERKRSGGGMLCWVSAASAVEEEEEEEVREREREAEDGGLFKISRYSLPSYFVPPFCSF